MARRQSGKPLWTAVDTYLGDLFAAHDEQLDAALKAALSEGKAVSHRTGGLILARVDTLADLHSALMRAADQLGAGTPIWFIYRKGPGHPLNENLVRTTALATGIVDTKVVSVSTVFSALRFVKRRS